MKCPKCGKKLQPVDRNRKHRCVNPNCPVVWLKKGE